MKYLLDTTVISDFVRGEAAVLERLKSQRPSDLAVTSVTVMEIEFGLALNPERATRIEPVVRDVLSSIGCLAYEREDALATARIRAALRRTGRPIGAYDALMAGTALRRGLIVVTSNVSEFERVSGLAMEDWRRPPQRS